MENVDQKIVHLLCEDLPLVSNPFAVLAKKIGISEREFIQRAKALESSGAMRRIGVAIFHKKIGYSHNVLVVWDIADEKVDETAKIIVSYQEVSHCYARVRNSDWQYNLYSMIHAKSAEEYQNIIKKISNAVGTDKFQELPTLRELKKTGMKYFPELIL